MVDAVRAGPRRREGRLGCLQLPRPLVRAVDGEPASQLLLVYFAVTALQSVALRTTANVGSSRRQPTSKH